MVAIGRYSEGTLTRMVLGSILNDVFRQSVGTCPVLIKSLNWTTKVSMKESGPYFKTSATRPHSSADFCTFIRLIALYTSPLSHAISVNCVGSKDITQKTMLSKFGQVCQTNVGQKRNKRLNDILAESRGFGNIATTNDDPVRHQRKLGSAEPSKEDFTATLFATFSSDADRWG